MKKEKPLGMRIGESVFCAGYLLFAAIAAIIFLKREGTFYHLCGLMTLLLGGGDAFHLIPRIIVNIKGETAKSPFWLGLGNLVSSITMTGFYLFLPKVLEALTGKPLASVLWIILCLLAVIRVILCLFPGNRWFSHDDNGNWGIYRNIPFTVIGLITVGYLIVVYKEITMAILVTLSFLCYLAVVLMAGKNPKMGMLMIPKTICYIWLIAILLGR